jgi:hypothetical protein
MHVGVSECKRTNEREREDWKEGFGRVSVLCFQLSTFHHGRPALGCVAARGISGATVPPNGAPPKLTTQTATCMTLLSYSTASPSSTVVRTHHHRHSQAVTHNKHPRIGHLTRPSYRISTEPHSNTNTLALARWERRLPSRL